MHTETQFNTDWVADLVTPRIIRGVARLDVMCSRVCELASSHTLTYKATQNSLRRIAGMVEVINHTCDV